jgi:hypothetical protein
MLLVVSRSPELSGSADQLDASDVMDVVKLLSRGNSSFRAKRVYAPLSNDALVCGLQQSQAEPDASIHTKAVAGHDLGRAAARRPKR